MEELRKILVMEGFVTKDQYIRMTNLFRMTNLCLEPTFAADHSCCGAARQTGLSLHARNLKICEFIHHGVDLAFAAFSRIAAFGGRPTTRVWDQESFLIVSETAYAAIFPKPF
jgi:hypothetical protein